MASFYDLTIGQHIEFLRVLTGAGLSAEDGKSVIDDPSRAKVMIEALHKPPLYPLPSWYVQPQQQIERVAYFVERYNGGLSSLMTMPIPPLPTDFIPCTPTEVLMLAVYLPDKGRTKGLQRTFDAWWDFATPPIGITKCRWDQMKSDSKHLHLLEGIEHRPGIRWVAFDPNANKGKSPQSCWDNPYVAPTLAGPEVLMALALFPNWAASWNGNKSPFSNMAGYQFKRNSAWVHCPCINRLVDDRQLWLDASSAVLAGDYWACPSVRGC